MKQCPHCGRFNYDTATDCRECGAALPVKVQGLGKSYWMGPEKAKSLRRKALSFVVLGLFMKVYWGGYGPWKVIDNPTLRGLRTWLEPLFLLGGAAVYLLGWVLNFV
jgi:hypothetical protein